MEDLIARLEKATGPDRELDAWLDVFLTAERLEWSDKFGDPITWEMIGKDVAYMTGKTDPAFPGETIGQAIERTTGCIRYTASLDAALTLIPKGWHWSVDGEWEWKRVAKEKRDKEWLEKFGKTRVPFSADEYGLPYVWLYAPDYHVRPAMEPGAAVVGIAQSAPIAICIAALKARGVSPAKP